MVEVFVLLVGDTSECLILLCDTKLFYESSAARDSLTPLTNDLRAVILADLLGRNSDDKSVHLLEIASFLDPRFKSKFDKDSHVES